ncbi:mechanosensitive ion channel family protein [Pacificispira sp.]|uniref:mechanosensitive ion channel family protein n=1 Tax=Pacificispira sp. TaxID=2888761 RepID=UPI003BAD6DE9
MPEGLIWLETVSDLVVETLTRRTFYYQVATIAVTIAAAWILSRAIRQRLPAPAVTEPGDAPTARRIVDRVGAVAYYTRELLFPAMSAALLGVAVVLSGEFFDRTWLVQLVQGMNFLSLLYVIATKVTREGAVKYFTLIVLVPITIFYAIGLLDDAIAVAEGIHFDLGSISVTAYGIIRTVIFGAILFWLGRLSNATGQNFIRRRVTHDDTTRELALKSFQILLFMVVALLFLQIAGIDLTALVVVGGAIGVGLGFGLQQIASNFISGIIILLDRSIAIGDFIELEDGRSGVLRELSMRSATLQTFDNKDIMVPNERFITTAFVNWTHYNKKQRYPLYFSVAYGTDLEKLFQIVREVVASHPQVLSGPQLPIEERPDAEISSFGDNGIEILVEFWMEGVDDGKNRVGADLLFMIWKALQENQIEIPFPQREVRIVHSDKKTSPG